MRTPNLPFPKSSFLLRRFRNKRPHAVNGFSNNTVCIRMIHIVRTGPTLLPGINQDSHSPPLEKELLREKFHSLLRDNYHRIRSYPYHWLHRETYRRLHREPLPPPPPVVLIQFQREIIMWIMIMELHKVDLAVTAGPRHNIIPNLTYPPVNGCLINMPQFPNSS